MRYSVLVVVALLGLPFHAGAQTYRPSFPRPSPNASIPNDPRVMITEVKPGTGSVRGTVKNMGPEALQNVTVTAHNIDGDMMGYDIVGILTPGEERSWEIREPSNAINAGKMPFNPFLGTRAY